MKRILSALILGPLTVAAVWYGSWAFYALMLFVFVVGVQEWSKLSFQNGRVSWGILGAGIPYIVIACLSAIWIRNHELGGLFLLFYVLFAIWACDIGAYAFGKVLGGPKLAPRISPNKTWSGMAGGALSAGIVLIAYDVWLDNNVPGDQLIDRLAWPIHGAIGVALALVGQAGDLIESFLKRRAGLKDSGNIIPGHGGLLDRVDALLLALPVFAVVLFILEWAF